MSCLDHTIVGYLSIIQYTKDKVRVNPPIHNTMFNGNFSATKYVYAKIWMEDTYSVHDGNFIARKMGMSKDADLCNN